MNVRTLSRAAAAAALILGTAAAAGAAPSVFKARMFTGGGANSAAAVNVRFTVDSVTTLEEAYALNQAIGGGSWDAFLALFRPMAKGTIQFTGGVGLKIPCHIATEETTPEGRTRVVLIAEGQPIDPFAQRNLFGPFIFLTVVLDVGPDGKGEGKAYEDSRFRFTPDGKVETGSSGSTPKVFVNVRKEK